MAHRVSIQIRQLGILDQVCVWELCLFFVKCLPSKHFTKNKQWLLNQISDELWMPTCDIASDLYPTPRMNLDPCRTQQVAAMPNPFHDPLPKEDRAAEDRLLLELVLKAQELHRQIEAVQAQMTDSTGSEMVVVKKEMSHLVRSQRKVLNELGYMLLNISRYHRLQNHLTARYNLPSVTWERLWNKAIDDRLSWLTRCSSEKDKSAPPAYVLYNPNHEKKNGAASVWTWFSSQIKNRIIDQMRSNQFREELNCVPIDAPVTNSPEGDSATIGDLIPSPPQQLNTVQQVAQLLRDDPDDVFTAQTFRSPNQGTITYQTIALKRIEGEKACNIAKELGVAPSTITRNAEKGHLYYRPYTHEMIFGQFWLPEGMAAKIREDQNGTCAAIILKSHTPQLSFQQMVLWKLQSWLWCQVARQLQPPPANKVVILFCLDHIAEQRPKSNQ